MKRILRKIDRLKISHKLHQAQKRWHRAKENGYPQDEIDQKLRIVEHYQELLKHIK